MEEDVIEVWRKFIFEGPRFNGLVPTKRDWDEVVNRHEKNGGLPFVRRALLFSAKCAREEAGMPRFGFTPEYEGSVTLGEWADAQDIRLDGK